jgi:hypothetical protein
MWPLPRTSIALISWYSFVCLFWFLPIDIIV